MIIAFLVPSTDIAGGNIVIAEFSKGLARRGHEVFLVSFSNVNGDLEVDDSTKNLNVISLIDAEKKEFDVVLATFWPTAYFASTLTAKKYLYLVQSLESRFEPKGFSLVRAAAGASYRLGLTPIVIADWLSGHVSKQTSAPVVRYGVDRDIFTYQPIDESSCKPFKVLIEGPIDTPLKNTDLAIKIAAKSDADEVWLLTSSQVDKVEGVTHVFSRQGRGDVASIMRECDVLLKISLVEGQPMPPIEMALSGRPSILSNLEGYHEYLSDRVSAIIIDEPYAHEAINAINKLKNDRNLLKKLGNAAYSSVQGWPSWDSATQSLELQLEEAPFNSAKLKNPFLLYSWQAQDKLNVQKSHSLIANFVLRAAYKLHWIYQGFRAKRLQIRDFS